MFPILSFDQNNPVLTGANRMMDLMRQGLMNRQLGIQNQYMPEMMQQDLLKQQLVNQLSQGTLQPSISLAQQTAQLYGPETQAKIRQMNSLSGLYGSESAKNNFMLNNPAYMAGGLPAQLAALQNLFKTNPELFNSPSAQPPAGQSPSPEVQQAPSQDLFSWLSQQRPQPPVDVKRDPLPGLNGGFMPQQSMATSGQEIPFDAQQRPLPGLGGGLLPQQPMATPAQAAPLPGLGGAPNQPQDLKSALINSFLAQAQLPAARAQLYNQKATGATYLNSPPDTKRYAVAQATSFGYSPDEAVKSFMQGKSVADLAQQKGYGMDPSKWPTPDYNPTVATLSRNQQRQTAVSELEAVEPFINNALGQYSQTIHGYSPQQVLDSFNSLNSNTPEGKAKKDKLSDFLAATIIVPEYNAIRARAMGVQNIGVEAMRNIGDASMNNFKKFQSLVPGDVYMSAQTKANQLIKQMNSAATKATLVPFQGQNSQSNDSTRNLLDKTAGETRVLNGKTYQKINGVWHEQ